MTNDTSYLDYDLREGYVHNWLVLGPQVVPLEDGAEDPSTLDDLLPEPRLGPEIAATAIEPAAPDTDLVHLEGFSGQWRYVSCLEDHLVVLPQNVGPTGEPAPEVLRGWAYAELTASFENGDAEAQHAALALSTAGAADLWLNGRHSQRVVVGGERLKSVSFDVALQPGRNQILVCFDVLRTVNPNCEAPLHAMALQVVAPEQAEAPAFKVFLPTRISRLPRRKWLEAVFESAVLPQYLFERQERLTCFWPGVDGAFPPDLQPADPEDTDLITIDLPPYPGEEDGSNGGGAPARPQTPPAGMTSLSIRVQTPAGRVYSEANPDIKGGSKVEMGFGYRYPDGPLDAVLMPRPKEYYQGNMRITRTVRFWNLDNNQYTDAPTADYQERRSQALLRAARREANLYSEIAKMAVGWWSKLNPGLIASAIEQIQAAHTQVYRDVVGLLGMVMRYGEAPEFPEGMADDLKRTLPALIFFDDVPPVTHRAASEGQELLSAVCEILAGQLAPEMIFAATGQTGEWHRERGEQHALALMRRIGMRGLRAWGSDIVTEEILLALAHIIDFVEDDAVWDLAMVLMDKMLFFLATNSYKGILGCAKARTQTASVLGGYLDATSGIAKLMWGMGIFTPDIRAVVSLACMEDYQFPVMLQEIASDVSDAVMWSRERHAPEAVGAMVATYRTADGLLSSVHDYRPGTLGLHEHVWQATLGAGATVFVNHPVRADLDDAGGPNFWRGNGVLPRVAQWQDALIALYRLPEDDWMGFTHAYFPIHAFDEVVIREGRLPSPARWVFARKGEGYLALWASQDLELMATGPSAQRELRARGTECIWLCQMGRAALDGDFVSFQEAVLALSVRSGAVTGEGVRWTTLRGDTLRFNWSDPPMRNDEPVDLGGTYHINNPYCVAELPASTMDIRYGGVAMRLNFAAQEPDNDEDL